MYRYYAEIYGARISALRYGSKMEFPLETVVPGLRKKPPVLFLANPNNPTGTLFGFRGLAKILRAATPTAVVLDGAYAGFAAFTAPAWIRRFAHLFGCGT